MSVQLYSLSGSPFGWKVQLALEHLAVPYATTMLSPDRGDTREPGFLALNPHGKLPVIVDGATTIYESDVIVEYLEDAHPQPGASLWPGSAVARALARRIAAEASAYVYPPVRLLATRWAGRPDPGLDRATLDETKRTVAEQMEIIAPSVADGFVAAARPGAADYALYPLVALLMRLDTRRPGETLTSLIPPELHAWAGRIESLAYFARTYPPHWKN